MHVRQIALHTLYWISTYMYGICSILFSSSKKLNIIDKTAIANPLSIKTSAIVIGELQQINFDENIDQHDN